MRKLCVVLLAALIAASSADVVMPIGIPNPWVQPDVARPAEPSDWSSPVAHYYFVNPQTGSDSGNQYGTPTAPRQTMPPRATTEPGSLIITEGSFTGGTINLQYDGDSGAWVAGASGPIWISSRGATTNDYPNWTREMLSEGSYLYIEKQKVTQPGVLRIGSSSVSRPADHIVVRNCVFVGAGTSAESSRSMVAGVGFSDAVRSQYILIYTNQMSDLGDTNSLSDVDNTWCSMTRHCHFTWVLYNSARAIVGGGKPGTASNVPTSESTHHYWGGNTIWNGRQNAMGVKYSEDVILSENHMHHILHNDESLSRGKAIGLQYKPTRVWLLFNRMEYLPYGVYMGSCDDVLPYPIYLIGNVFRGIGSEWSPGAPAHGGGTTDEEAVHEETGYAIHYINNTIIDCDQGFGSGGGTTTQSWHYNNLFYRKTAANGAFIAYTDSNDVQVNRRNLYYTASDARFVIGGVAYTSVAALESAHAASTLNLNSDPLLVSETDFNLQPSSPARDIGTAPASFVTNVYQLFFDLYGIDIQKDIQSRTRPQGAGMDLGAYEALVSASSGAMIESGVTASSGATIH